MPFLAGLLPLIGVGTAAGGATTAASVISALGTLGGLAGAGVGIGESVANAGASADAQKQSQEQMAQLAAQQQQQQQLQTQQQNQQRAQTASQQAPNVLSATSGLAVPDYLLSALTSSAGPSPGIQGVLNNAFGGGASQFQPAGLGGGSGAQNPANLTDLQTNILYG